MKRTIVRPTAALPAVLLLALVACEAQKSSNPLSPSVAGPIAGVNITAPVLLEPAQGFKFKESQQPIKLLIENASSTGVRPLTYTFEIASDANFDTKVFARSAVPPGEGGRTSVQVDRLDLGRAYYWRARADDGANQSVYSSAQFEVLPKPDLSIPALWTPVNGVTASRTPTLKIGNSTRNLAVGDVRYQFQVAKDAAFTALSATGEVAEGSGSTEWVVDRTLDPALLYYWRARATDGDTTTSWSNAQTFRTPAASSPGPGPSPSPGTPGSCASNNGEAVVRCVENKYPQYLVAGVSHNQRVANMEFLRDRVIESGICGGMDLAWNLKRGTGPRSIDAIAWRTNGRVEVVDIGTAYDDTNIPLRLSWGIVAGPAGWDAYPRPNCQ